MSENYARRAELSQNRSDTGSNAIKETKDSILKPNATYPEEKPITIKPMVRQVGLKPRSNSEVEENIAQFSNVDPSSLRHLEKLQSEIDETKNSLAFTLTNIEKKEKMISKNRELRVQLDMDIEDADELITQLTRLNPRGQETEDKISLLKELVDIQIELLADIQELEKEVLSGPFMEDKFDENNELKSSTFPVTNTINASRPSPNAQEDHQDQSLENELYYAEIEYEALLKENQKLYEQLI